MQTLLVRFSPYSQGLNFVILSFSDLEVEGKRNVFTPAVLTGVFLGISLGRPWHFEVVWAALHLLGLTGGTAMQGDRVLAQ